MGAAGFLIGAGRRLQERWRQEARRVANPLSGAEQCIHSSDLWVTS
jgi:hypothetical protein